MNSLVFALLIVVVLCMTLMNVAYSAELSADKLKTEWKVMDKMLEKSSTTGASSTIVRDGFHYFPHHFAQHEKASEDTRHTLHFELTPKMSMDEIAKLSDPSSPNYRRDITSADVSAMKANPTATTAVTDYLEHHGVDVKSTSDEGLFLSASAPVSVWNKILNTQFHVYKNEINVKNSLVRAPEYSLPTHIASYVAEVKNAVDFPTPLGISRIKGTDATATAAAAAVHTEDFVTLPPSGVVSPIE